MAQPTTTNQWTVTGQNGLDSLHYSEQSIPELGDNEVLVKIQGASLNFRDLLVTQGKYPWPVKENIIPGSDGAGTVLTTGKNVTRFRPGDKVITMLNQQHTAGSLTAQTAQYGVGASIDGTLRTVGAFDEQGLVSMPSGLSFTEAATLSCAGVTAWNALYGLAGKEVRSGQWVLTQGTGGVSVFAVQFAKAAGARVIATTSDSKGEKGELLRRLGADYVVDYKERKDWGVLAKELAGGIGVDIVVEVAGASSMRQSVEAVKLDGVISVVGFVGGQGKGEMPTLLDTWMKLFTARGLWVGSRLQMEEMCRAIEGNLDRLRPVIGRTFALDEVKEAYEYMLEGKHQGKIAIDLDL